MALGIFIRSLCYCCSKDSKIRCWKLLGSGRIRVANGKFRWQRSTKNNSSILFEHSTRSKWIAPIRKWKESQELNSIYSKSEDWLGSCSSTTTMANLQHSNNMICSCGRNQDEPLCWGIQRIVLLRFTRRRWRDTITNPSRVPSKIQ